jgi:hypothetical protein
VSSGTNPLRNLAAALYVQRYRNKVAVSDTTSHVVKTSTRPMAICWAMRNAAR